MANKKLGTAASELRMPAKKAKVEKKPKWQAKTGGKKPKEIEVAEPVEAAIETPSPEVEQSQEETTPAETPTDEIATEPTPTVEPTEAPVTDEPTPDTNPEPTPAKPKKLKVKADLKPRS